MIQPENASIAQIVSHNHKAAKALHFLGIHFYDHSEATLMEVCREKGLSLSAVVQKITQAALTEDSTRISLIDYPVDLVIEYLKHNHYLFVKDRLPYISTLVRQLDGFQNEACEELKLAFPLFVEDFIEHIYEEEDTLFTHILAIYKRCRGEVPTAGILELDTLTVQSHALDHAIHEDALKGIRQLTNHFSVSSADPLPQQVAFQELRQLDQDLMIHARIENEILFPKALQLERQLRLRLEQTVNFN